MLHRDKHMDYFLTIAASDNSGGAGIQQDIKVAHDHGYWALSAITGITVQDFNSVYHTEPVSPEMLKKQIERCLQSFPVKVVKIGTICSQGNIKVIAECIKRFPDKKIVLDTVLASTGGVPFLNDASRSFLTATLFPLTDLVTPNKTEFELLAGQKFESLDEGINIAIEKNKKWGTSILLKGGHFSNEKIEEALVTSTDVYRFERERYTLKYSHGTGCTLSSAIACFLGKGEALQDAYLHGSAYVVDVFTRMSALAGSTADK